VTEFDKVIPPGGAGKVTAAIHTTSFKGPISKSVTVTTNDPDHRNFILTLKATVAIPIEILPGENVSFLGRYDALKPQELTLKASDGKPFDITSAKPADPAYGVAIEPILEAGMTAKRTPGTVASGSSQYKVTISPPKDPKVGRITSTVDLATTHPKTPAIALRITGNVMGDITFAPQTVLLMGGAKATAEQKQSRILVQNPTGTTFKVLEVTANNPALKSSFETVEPGREYEVVVKYDGPPLTTALNGLVTIRTSDARQPTVEIPVWCRADPAPRAASPVPTAAQPTALPVKVTPAPPSKSP